MAGKDFLNKVYRLKSVTETRRLYDDWSVSYDDEISKNGYATPGRIAKALAQLLTDRSRPILDFGCGTGMAGAKLLRQDGEHLPGIGLRSTIYVLKRL